jgi:hypothetical protein
MSSDRTSGMAQRFGLTRVQLAVFVACSEHTACTFAAITPAIWWRGEDPFRGSRAAFATHLRALARVGMLSRRQGPEAAYDLTRRGERLVAALNEPR